MGSGAGVSQSVSVLVNTVMKSYGPECQEAKRLATFLLASSLLRTLKCSHPQIPHFDLCSSDQKKASIGS